MGYFKQLHIDCSETECLAGQEETCYKRPDNPAYYPEADEDTSPDRSQDFSGGDYDPQFDEDQE